MTASKKRMAIAAGAAVLLIAGTSALFFALSDKPTEKNNSPNLLKPFEDAGPYTGYHLVVTARDTPDSVAAELANYDITPVGYERNRELIGPGGLVDTRELPDNAKIYLCEGEYEAGTGSFISLTSSSGLTVTGAGADKTVIKGGGLLSENRASALLMRGSLKAPVRGIKLSNITVSGFGTGILLEYAENIQMNNMNITGNSFFGVSFSDTKDIKLDGCTLSLNGDPEKTDTGYGLTFMKKNSGVSVVNSVYHNNANTNAVDFLGRGEKEAPDGAELQMTMSYDIIRTEKPVVDPEAEAQNAKPSAKSMKLECEDAVLIGAEITSNAEKVEAFSGGSYVFLYDGRITMKFNVEEAGQYRIFVVGATTEPNNKCDFVRVNNGQEYLTSYLAKNAGKWSAVQPGTEVWENNELHPKPLTNGFELKKGENIIEISANWGYAAYDHILIEKIQ